MNLTYNLPAWMHTNEIHSTERMQQMLTSNIHELNYTSIANAVQLFALTLHYITRKAPHVGANSSSVFAFDMHYK